MLIIIAFPSVPKIEPKTPLLTFVKLIAGLEPPEPLTVNPV